jgi:hypothetical protein
VLRNPALLTTSTAGLRRRAPPT